MTFEIGDAARDHRQHHGALRDYWGTRRRIAEGRPWTINPANSRLVGKQEVGGKASGAFNTGLSQSKGPRWQKAGLTVPLDRPGSSLDGAWIQD
jgi:hypothetical protein